MKWFSVLPILALAFLSSACEKHPASELPPEHATAFGEHAAHGESTGHGGGEKAEPKPAGEAAAPAKAESSAPAGEAKPGEAPKFFPENK